MLTLGGLNYNDKNKDRKHNENSLLSLAKYYHEMNNDGICNMLKWGMNLSE